MLTVLWSWAKWVMALLYPEDTAGLLIFRLPGMGSDILH